MKFSGGKYSAIYIATQRYIVVLRCAMIKVAEEGCIVLLKGGGRGAYRRALSSCYRLALRKYYSNLSSFNYCFIKTPSQGLLCVKIQDGGYRLCGVCGLAYRHLGFAM